jgi:hypothetical protein
MPFPSVASMNLTDLLRPKAQGAQVNSHVLPATRDPVPDYEAMRRLVATPTAPPLSSNERTTDQYGQPSECAC